MFKLYRKEIYARKLMVLLLLSFIFSNKVSAQSLDSYLQLTVANNPELKSLEKEYEMAQEKINQVKVYKNPEVGVGIPISRPETRLGPQVLMVSANQMFPWFGTFQAKEAVMVTMSKAKFERIAVLKLDLFSKVKTAYYQIVFLEERKQIIKEFIVIYKTLENVSLAKVESGQSTISDVLRLQLKLQELEQELKIIDNQKLQFVSQINRLTNQGVDNDVVIDVGLEDGNNSNVDFEYNIDTFKSKIESNHPLMNKINLQLQASEQKQEEFTNFNKPTIGVGIDYSLVNKRTDANPLGNGNDIFIPKLKLSIPINRKITSSKIKEESLYQESLEFQKVSLTNTMLDIIIQNKLRLDNANLKMELYQNQIKTTQMAYEVLLSNYSSSGGGFTDLLQIQNQLLRYKLGLKQEELNNKITQTNIERIVGF